MARGRGLYCKKSVTVQQACAFTAYAVRKRRFGKSKSHCEAILDGFWHVTMKVLNSYKSPMKRIHKVKTAVIVKDTIPDDITLENGLEITYNGSG